jgi:hypothetical protein
MKNFIGIHSAISNQLSSTAAGGRGGRRPGQGGCGCRGSQLNTDYLPKKNIYEVEDVDMEIPDRHNKLYHGETPW